jgi:hypothetical protein
MAPEIWTGSLETAREVFGRTFLMLCRAIEQPAV